MLRPRPARFNVEALGWQSQPRNFIPSSTEGMLRPSRTILGVRRDAFAIHTNQASKISIESLARIKNAIR
jgi:hypothetical protein